MNNSNAQKSWSWKRLLRFNLRAVMILIALVAVACAIYLQSEEKTIGKLNGAFTIRYQIRNVSTNDGDVAQRHGRWILQDKTGRTRVIGYFQNDQPHGSWTAYYDNGLKAWQGRCEDGAPTGTWNAWRPDGSRLAVYERHDGGPSVYLDGVRDIDAIFRSDENELVVVGGVFSSKRFGKQTFNHTPGRHGAMTAYDSDDQQRVTGAYTNDRRTGEWTFYSDHGEVSASGTYVNGLRHGVWQVHDEEAGQLNEVAFIRGRRVDDLDVQLARCSKLLGSSSLNDQLAAASRLETFADFAVPTLTTALREDDPTVQFLALRTFGRIGPPASDALSEIAEFVVAKNPRVRLHAVTARFSIDVDNRKELLHDTLSEIESVENLERRAAMFARLYVIDEVNRPHIFKRMLVSASKHGESHRDDLAYRIEAAGISPLKFFEDVLTTADTKLRITAYEMLFILYRQASGLGEREPYVELLRRACGDDEAAVQRHAKNLLAQLDSSD